MAAGIFCKGCGYDLAGIGAGVCPECARAFDPASPTTYDTTPRRTRRRKWMVRLGVAGALVLLTVVFFPRGYADASLAIVMPDGSVAGFTRVELIPPAWLRGALRYPRWTRRTADAPLTPGRALDFRAGGRRFTAHGTTSTGMCTATSGPSAAPMQLNGVTVSPENANAIFATVVPDIAADRSFGVSIGSAGSTPTTTRHTVGRN